MSRALQQISCSPFSEEIESTDLSQRFTRLTFTIYDGKTNLVEHVSHYNQSMAFYYKNEALMCKLFPSSLGPTTMRRFDGLEKDSICGYDELIRSFGARFITCSRTPKAFDSLFTMSIRKVKPLEHT